MKAMNFEFEREIGFINSQPSLAECLTSFPPVGDTFQSSSIKNSTLSHSTLIPPPFEQTIPSLNPGSHPRHSSSGRPKHSPNGSSGSPVPAGALQPPEYPWMKEKKASKKSALPPPSSASATGPACLSHKGQLKDFAAHSAFCGASYPTPPSRCLPNLRDLNRVSGRRARRQTGGIHSQRNQNSPPNPPAPQQSFFPLTCLAWDDLFELEVTSSCLPVLELGYLTVMKSDRLLLLS